MLRKLKAIFSDLENTATHSDMQLERAVVALLMEIAKADYDNDPRERTAIVAAIKRRYPREETLVQELLEEAAADSDRATSLYEFTRIINDHCNYDEKYWIVLELWRVALADGRIDKYEDNLVRRVADLIYVEHSDYIRAKHAAQGEAR